MIDGTFLISPARHSDDRGFLMEAYLQDDLLDFTAVQSNISLTYPGVVRAFHWHKNQDDYWIVPKGMIQAVLYDRRSGSATQGQTHVVYMGEQRMQGLFIPRGVAHGYRVLGNEPALLVYFVNQRYNPDEPDEERIPYNDPAIGFDWSTRMR